MPDPTDHRAQAEDWLDAAKDMWAGADKTGATRLDYGSLAALIGIGHALLAGLLDPVEREWIPPAGICPRCGRSDHAETAHDEAAARIAEAPRFPVDISDLTQS